MCVGVWGVCVCAEGGGAVGKKSRRYLILFLEKFIDKYNDFIQYFNTHYFILCAKCVCLYACLSVCLCEGGGEWGLITLLIAQ